MKLVDESKQQMATFQRPTLRKLGGVSKVFTTVQQGGASVSAWVATTKMRTVATGTPGRVGEICTEMHRGDCVKRYLTEWTPQCEYEFYAERALPESERAAYIERCKKWFEEHPPRIPKAPKAPVEYSREMIAEFYSKRTTMPSLEERVAAFRKAGMPEERIAKHVAWHEVMEATSDERQKVIDDIFGVYVPPKSKTKAVTKSKTIKPVKKKMP
jgi:hypothetical protein